MDADTSITVGTPSWFTWLEQHTTFAFVSAQGRFTARKERNQSRGSYWKAYRKCAGHLRSVYLGRSIDLTLDRLVGAAERLAQASPTQAATAPRPPSGVCSEDQLDEHHADQYGLLRTRLLMPALRPRRVVRPRLLDRLRADPTHQLILVAAPAGFGKTTLLADWIVTDQRAAAWLTLDSGDNDPIRFWTAVVAALDTLKPGVGVRAACLLRIPQPPPLTTVISILLDDLVAQVIGDAQGRPALLVLDDYHLIMRQDIHEILALLLEHLPPHIRLVIASRTDPPLPLSRLRVHNRLTEIGYADLAFTVEEMAVFLEETIGIPLDRRAVVALAARTEGWAAALQLAALSLRDHDDPAAFIATFDGSHRHLFSYLLEEVVSQLSANLQRFLLYTSVLDLLCVDLCDAVLDDDGVSQNVLPFLDRAGLFVIPLDSSGRWYRYHHLFADMLRHRLRCTNPTLEPTLRRRASIWYEREGLPVESKEELAVHRSSFIVQPLAEPLTRRELEVLRLLADGHTNSAIAAQLVIAVTTVKWYLRTLYAKLDVRNRTQAAARARALGLL